MTPPAKRKKSAIGAKICPYLKKNEYNLCIADPGAPMVPSISELSSFCLSGRSEDCEVKKSAEVYLKS